jgi:tRNA (guanine-N7-)-methyltransferase
MLHIVTDVEEYYGSITELVNKVEGMRSLPPPQPQDPSHDLDYLTNFERKFRKEGRPIFRALYVKVEVPSTSGVPETPC